MCILYIHKRKRTRYNVTKYGWCGVARGSSNLRLIARAWLRQRERVEVVRYFIRREKQMCTFLSCHKSTTNPLTLIPAANRVHFFHLLYIYFFLKLCCASYAFISRREREESLRYSSTPPPPTRLSRHSAYMRPRIIARILYS